MRRRILVAGSTLLGIGLTALLTAWWLQPRPRIDQDSFEMIQVGMTEAEVIEIIGAPPGDYGVGTGTVLLVWHTGIGSPAAKSWLGQDVGIEVNLTADGKVAGKALRHVWREYDSQLDRVCQFLRLKEPKAARWNTLGYIY